MKEVRAFFIIAAIEFTPKSNIPQNTFSNHNIHTTF